MRNNIFDLHRYWRYQKHIWKTNWLQYAIWGGAMLLYFIIIMAIYTNNSGYNNDFQFIGILIAILGTILINCLICYRYGYKSGCISEMLIPASNLEKYLSRLTTFAIVPSILFVAFMVANNLIATTQCHDVLMNYKTMIMIIVAGFVIVAVAPIARRQSFLVCCAMVYIVPKLIPKHQTEAEQVQEYLNDNGAYYIVFGIASILILSAIGYVFFKRMNLTSNTQKI